MTEKIYPQPFLNPVPADAKGIGEKIVELIGDQDGHLIAGYNGLTIDTGEVYYTHRAWPDRKFYEETAVAYNKRSAAYSLENETGGFDEEEMAALTREATADESLTVTHDTRLSIGKVISLVRKAERGYNMVIQGITPDDEEASYCGDGPWDEGISVWPDMRHNNEYKKRWPNEYHYMQSYVVHGGSEGYWLHFDMIYWENGGTPQQIVHHKHLIMGKSLAGTWAECYASAGRIAYMLGA